MAHKYLLSFDLGHMLKSLRATQKAIYVFFRHTGFSTLMLELEVIINDTECFINVNIGSVCFYIFETTSAQIYITTHSLYIIFTPTCFDISVSSLGSFKNLCLAKLRKFLKLSPLIALIL